MGFNEVFRDFVDRWKQRKERERDIAEQLRLSDKISENIEQKKLSHQERVLNKLLEEDRQKQIRRQLDLVLKLKRLEDRIMAKKMMEFNQDGGGLSWV